MWGVSERYQAYIGAHSVESTWYGTIRFTDGTSVSFNSQNIDQNKSKLTRQCVNGENLEIGNVFSSQLVLGLRDSSTWSISSKRYNYYDSVITLYFRLNYPDNTSEEVYCGQFKVNQAERTYHTIILTGYDEMNKFSGKLDHVLTGTYTPYDALSTVCALVGVTLGMTRQEIMAFPNGSRSDLKMSIYKKGASYKDIIGNICTMLAANAVCDRYGRMVLLQYGTTSVREIFASSRYSSSFIDYVGHYTSIYVVNKKGEVEEFNASSGTSDLRDLSINIGKNTLINSYSSTGQTPPRTAIINNIIQFLSDTVYAPCNIKMPCDPSLDLGDMITISGGELGEEGSVDILCTKIEMPLFGQMKIVSEGGSYELDIDNAATEKERRDEEDKRDQEEVNENQEAINDGFESNIGDIEDDITDINNDITDINNDIDNMNAKFTVGYILPYQINTNGVSDGATVDVLKFKFTCDRDGDTVSFYSQIGFTVTTTSTSDSFGDCVLTVAYYVDNTQVASSSHTYGDGSMILTLNGLLTDLSKTQHTFDVKFTAHGGSLS